MTGSYPSPQNLDEWVKKLEERVKILEDQFRQIRVQNYDKFPKWPLVCERCGLGLSADSVKWEPTNQFLCSQCKAKNVAGR